MARQAENAQEEALALRDLGAFHNLRSEYDAAQASFREALEIFQTLDDRRGVISCLQYLAVVYHFLNQLDLALDHYQRAQAAWLELGERRFAAKTQTNVGYLSITMGNLDLAEESFLQAEAILRDVSAQGALAWTLIGLGAVYRFRNKGRACLDTLAEAAELNSLTGSSPYLQALIHHHRGVALWHLGDTEAAIADLDEALISARQSETPTLIAGILIDLGRFLRQDGNTSRAAVLHREGLQIAREAGLLVNELYLQGELALDRLITQDGAPGTGPDGVLEELESALDRANEALPTDHLQLSIPLLNLAEGYLLAGQPARALAPAEKCLRLMRKADMKDTETWACRVLGDANIALDRPAAAARVLRRGVDGFDRTSRAPARSYMLKRLSQIKG
jgi:tetratricopeptide (TPR) repeat protein